MKEIISYSTITKWIFTVLVIIIITAFFLGNNNSYMQAKLMIGVLISPFILLNIFFCKIIINEQGIDVLYGYCNANLKYKGILYKSLKWKNTKILFEKNIKFVNIKNRGKFYKRNSIIIYQMLMNYKHAILLISKYGRNNLSKEELLVFDDELEKKKNYRNFSKIFYGKE